MTEKNFLAQENLAIELAKTGRPDEALPHWEAAAAIWEEATAVKPDVADFHFKLGQMLQRTGREQGRPRGRRDAQKSARVFRPGRELDPQKYGGRVPREPRAGN